MTTTGVNVKTDEESVVDIDALSIPVTNAKGSKDLNKSVKQGPRSFGDSISQRESFTPQTFVGVAKWDYVGDLKESPYFQPLSSSKKPAKEEVCEQQVELKHLPEKQVLVVNIESPGNELSSHENDGSMSIKAPTISKSATALTGTQNEKTFTAEKPSNVSTEGQGQTVLSASIPAIVRIQDTTSKLSAVSARGQDGRVPTSSGPREAGPWNLNEKAPASCIPKAISLRNQNEKVSNQTAISVRKQDEKVPATAISPQNQHEKVSTSSNPTATSTRNQIEKDPTSSSPTAISAHNQNKMVPTSSSQTVNSPRNQNEKVSTSSNPTATSPRNQNEKVPASSSPTEIDPRNVNEKVLTSSDPTTISPRNQNGQTPSTASATTQASVDSKLDQTEQLTQVPKPEVNNETVPPKDKNLNTIVFNSEIDLTASDLSIGENCINCVEDEMVDSDEDEFKYSTPDEDDLQCPKFSKNKKNDTYSSIDQTKIAFLSSKHTKLTSTRFSPATTTATDRSGDSSSDACVLYQAKDVTQLLLPEHAESVAADAFLRMCNVNFIVDERINVEYMSPSGRGPLLRCGPVLVAEFEPIVAFIESIGIRLTKNLSDQQLGELQAYASLIRNTLVPAELFVSWMHAGTRLEVTELYYAQYHPFPLNVVVNRRKQQAAWDLVKALDRPLTSLNDAYFAVERCLRSLNDRLGPANYFFGSVPTQLDALVYGHLLLLGTLPVPKGDCFLRTMLGNYPALVMLVERIDQLTERRSDLSFMKEGICEVKTKALIDSYIEARQISSLAAVGNKTFDYLGGMRRPK